MTRFRLTGEVSSDDLAAVRPVLAQMLGPAGVAETPGGLHVEGVLDGADAREVNRRLLSALRRAEKRTRLRAEWTGGASSAGSLTTCQRARVLSRRTATARSEVSSAIIGTACRSRVSRAST
jgi:hypothetical protein